LCDVDFRSVPGTTKRECLGGNDVVACLTGPINVTVGSNTFTFERATFVDGKWYGSTCEGKITVVDELNPFFNCYDTVVPTPCSCTFQDTGASLGLNAPVSSCLNTEHQVVQCDEKIYVQVGDELISYDRVTCSRGKWFGLNCDGTLKKIIDVEAKLQCGPPPPPSCAPIATWISEDCTSSIGMECVEAIQTGTDITCPPSNPVLFFSPTSGPVEKECARTVSATCVTKALRWEFVNGWWIHNQTQ
ncbi:hypothetical protein PFISCL1PPCAC_4503, partial [Pristionchus fissidentatus]